MKPHTTHYEGCGCAAQSLQQAQERQSLRGDRAMKCCEHNFGRHDSALVCCEKDCPCGHEDQWAAAEARGRAACEAGHKLTGPDSASDIRDWADSQGIRLDNPNRVYSGHEFIDCWDAALVRCAATHAALEAEAERRGADAVRAIVKPLVADLAQFGQIHGMRFPDDPQMRWALTGEGERPTDEQAEAAASYERPEDKA